MEFPCTKCGACCKAVGHIVNAFQKIPDHQLSALELEFKHFPFKTTKGICEKYQEGIGCSIYAERPSVCSTEHNWKTHFKGMSWEEYIQASKKTCAVIIDSLGMDKKWKP